MPFKHFQAAAQANPNADEIKFDLADAYFRKGLYPRPSMLHSRFQSRAAKTMPTWLCWEMSTRTWVTQPARKRFTAMPSAVIQTTIRTISRWLCWSCASITSPAQSRRCCKVRPASRGQGRFSGAWDSHRLWKVSTAEAGQRFERAVEMLPEWPGSYSTLGCFLFSNRTDR